MRSEVRRPLVSPAWDKGTMGGLIPGMVTFILPFIPIFTLNKCKFLFYIIFEVLFWGYCIVLGIIQILPKHLLNL